MTYNNVRYIIDNSLFFKNKDLILELSFNDDIVYKTNKNEFIKKYLAFLKKNKINRFFYNKSLLVINDSSLSKHDLNYLKNLFYEIGYKYIFLKSDKSFLKIDKKNSYLIIGKNDKLFFVDNFNHKKQINFDKSCISFPEELYLIQKKIKNTSLIIIGNINENILKFNNYYIIENKEKFFLDKIL